MIVGGIFPDHSSALAMSRAPSVLDTQKSLRASLDGGKKFNPANRPAPSSPCCSAVLRGCEGVALTDGRCSADSRRKRPPPHGHATTPHLSVSDRKSTRLNSSHLGISYAVFCLK